jgi:hypothetical protein
MQLIASIAAFAAAVNTVQALGNAIIYNQCSFDTYVWPVDSDRNPSTPDTIKANSKWSEAYYTPTAGGVSLKIALGSSLPDSTTTITQFEYTIAAYLGTPYVWYDGSNVNCEGTACPFEPYGLNLISSNSACPTRNCTANAGDCPGFYQVYNDDVNTLSCDDSADTVLYLCSGGSSGGSSSVAAAPVSSSVSVAPVSTAAATTTAPATSSAAKQTMQALQYTTLTKAARNHPRAAGHLHARHHGHQQ